MSLSKESAIKVAMSGYPATTGIWNYQKLNVSNEKKLRVTARDVNVGNTIIVTATSGNDPLFQTIATISGAVEMQIVDVSIYDFINVDLTVRDPANSSAAIYLSSTIDPPGGFGQASSADSSPVVLSTEQETILDAIKTATEAINIDADSIAKESGGNLDIISGDTTEIAGKLPTIGSQASAASLSVTLSSDEPDIGTTVTSGTISVSNLLADNHNVTVSNASLAVTGPLTDAELRLSDVGVAVTGLLGDGHNVTVDNDATDGIPIINQTGDTLSVGGAVTVTSGAVVVSQGTRSSLNANSTIQVQGTDVTLTSGLPIQNETGTNLGVDVVNVSGSAINDGNAIHVSQGTAANLKATVTQSGTVNVAGVPVDGLLVNINQSLLNKAWDYVAPVFNATNDVYTFKTGGSGGSTVMTVTVTYTDSSKGTLSSVART